MKKTLILAILMTFLGTQNISAYEWEYRPQLRVSLNWDDNIEDESTNEKEDYFFAVSPRLEIRGSGEKSSFFAGAEFSAEVYREFEEFNEISRVRFNIDFDYDPSESTRFSLPASFTFSPRAETGRETLVVADDGGLPDTQVITRRADRYRFSTSPSIRYLFTQRASSTLRGSFRTTQYSEDISGVTDSVTYGFGGGVGYAFTRKTTGGIDLSYSTTDFDEGNDSDIYSSSLSVTHLYSRAVTLSASGGISYISPDNQDSDLDWIASIGTAIRLKRARYYLSVSRSVRESTFGEISTRDSARGTFRIPLTRRVDAGLNGGITRSRSSDGDEDLLIKYTSARLDYRPLRHLSLFLRGSHEEQDERAVAGEDIRINRVSAGFVLSARLGGASAKRPE